MIGKIRQFFMEVIAELKKVSWTTRPELIDATWIVFASSAILGIYIALTDIILARCVGLLIR